jgi:hypothetical protein
MIRFPSLIGSLINAAQRSTPHQTHAPPMSPPPVEARGAVTLFETIQLATAR